MYMHENVATPNQGPETEHSFEELAELYNYLVDTYGVDSRRENVDISAEQPSLPKLTGVAAVKAALFGDHRSNPPLPTFIETERSVDMPVVPARNPNDTRNASLFRRYTPEHGTHPEETALLFNSWTQRSDEEARKRAIGGEHGHRTYDRLFYGLLVEDRRPEGQKFKRNETNNIWFDYLTKVKVYRDSGEYERSGYGPFIDQNIDLLRAMEETMDLKENDQEVQRDAKQAFDKEQIERSKQFIQDWLADVPIPEWTYVPVFYWYEREGDYNVRRRQIELRAPAGSSLPTLSILEYQSENEKIGMSRLRVGLLTRYTVSLGDEGNLMKYVYQGDFTPATSFYPEPKDKNQYVRTGELPPEILDSTTSEELNERLADFPKFREYALSTQAICNQIMAKYRELEAQGQVTKTVVEH